MRTPLAFVDLEFNFAQLRYARRIIGPLICGLGLQATDSRSSWNRRQRSNRSIGAIATRQSTGFVGRCDQSEVCLPGISSLSGKRRSQHPDSQSSEGLRLLAIRQSGIWQNSSFSSDAKTWNWNASSTGSVGPFRGPREVRVMQSNFFANLFWERGISHFTREAMRPVRVEKNGQTWHLSHLNRSKPSNNDANEMERCF